MIRFAGLFLLLLVGCSYHAGSGPIVSNYATVSIPYAEGDRDGSFTSQLVERFCSASPLSYLSSGGNLLLKVNLKDSRVESVGFRYAINESDERVKTIVSSEDRLSMLAEVSLIDSATCQTLLGPLYFTASVDYDFQPESSDVDLTQFSLGQVDFRGAARDAAHVPLYDQLAKKIVNYINAAW